VKVYTRKGDDGTTGLLFGTRVGKNDPLPTAYGDVDEAQAVLGLVRAEAPDGELADIVVGIQRDLWTLMGEVAVAADQRHKLGAESRVSKVMVERLEATIDDVSTRFEPPTEFVLPGANRVAAALDVARTVVRRAERHVVAVPDLDAPLVLAYLNRLSDLLWTLARWREGESLPSRPR
jgi:cob(I)alamin adenosyltransferase